MSEIFDQMSDELLDSGDVVEELPRAFATLHIDLRLMTPEQRAQTDAAVDLLREAGVRCDRGMGFGFYDLELDWSLNGAYLHVKPFICPQCHADDFDVVHWWIARRRSDGFVERMPFCSPRCRAERCAEYGDDWELLAATPGPALRVREFPVVAP